MCTHAIDLVCNLRIDRVISSLYLVCHPKLVWKFDPIVLRRILVYCYGSVQVTGRSFKPSWEEALGFSKFLRFHRTALSSLYSETDPLSQIVLSDLLLSRSLMIATKRLVIVNCGCFQGIGFSGYSIVPTLPFTSALL